MASAFKLISSQVLSGTAASVNFFAISSTYTDLCVKISARGDSAITGIKFNFNGGGGTLYSDTAIYGNGSSVGSLRDSSDTVIWGYAGSDGSGDTANTFSNAEIYIPSYTIAQNKPLSFSGAREYNSASSSETNTAVAGLYRSTSAISSITISTPSGNFVSGSSFYLFGIKNS